MKATSLLEERFCAAWPPEDWQDVSVLLAVSGGPDSVALLRMVLAVRGRGPGRLIVAHVNHGLRGSESDADESFVNGLCQQLGVPFESGRVDLRHYKITIGQGLEAAARQARYALLKTTAERLGARYLVTGHTADDQAETILHRTIRGTGIAGLAGMPRTRSLGTAVSLIRPLLDFRRRSLIAYLDSLKQSYRLDSTNDDTQRTRNAIRHKLIPTLESTYNKRATEALVRLGRLAAEAQAVIDSLVADLVPHCVINRTSGSFLLRGRPLVGQPPYVVRELLLTAWRDRGWPEQAMGFAQWHRLAEFLLVARDGSCYALPGGLQARKEGKDLLLISPG